MLKEPPEGGSFLLGGEQKPREAVRVRKKVAVIFYQEWEKFFSGAAGIFWRRGRKKRPVSRWWATGRFAVFQRRNEVRYTKLPHSAGLFTMYLISLHKSTKNLRKING